MRFETSHSFLTPPSRASFDPLTQGTKMETGRMATRKICMNSESSKNFHVYSRDGMYVRNEREVSIRTRNCIVDRTFCHIIS